MDYNTQNQQELEYINQRLIDILGKIDEKYEELGKLINEFHNLVGDSNDATVDNSQQVKNLLNKYSSINK